MLDEGVDIDIAILEFDAVDDETEVNDIRDVIDKTLLLAEVDDDEVVILDAQRENDEIDQWQSDIRRLVDIDQYDDVNILVEIIQFIVLHLIDYYGKKMNERNILNMLLYDDDELDAVDDEVEEKLFCERQV